MECFGKGNPTYPLFQPRRSDNYEYWCSDAETMLRQQQAEIEALKADKDRITRDLIGASFYEHDYKTLMAKPPLTDEEIDEIANQYLDWIPCGHSEKIVGVIDFARAILKKASEK